MQKQQVYRHVEALRDEIHGHALAHDADANESIFHHRRRWGTTAEYVSTHDEPIRKDMIGFKIQIYGA